MAASAETRVYLIQLLCPSRHAILALGLEAAPEHLPSDETAATQMMLEVVRIAQLAPRCGICGSEELHAEIGRTAFATLEAAAPVLKQIERENLRARTLIGARY